MSLFSAMPVWLTLPGAMSTTCKHVCSETQEARHKEGDACFISSNGKSSTNSKLNLRFLTRTLWFLSVS